MAENRNGKHGKTVTKADVILAQIERLVRQTASLEARVGQGGGNAGGYGEVIRKLQEENAKLKQEIRYVSAQIEGVCATITKMVQKLPSQISGGAVPVEGADGVRISNVEFDYDALGYSVAKRIYVPQAIAEEIDYEQLAGKVADKMPPVTIDYDELGYSVAKRMYIPNAIAEDVDYDQIADKICEKVPAFSTPREPEYVETHNYAEPMSVNAEIDYDLLAAKVAEAIPEQEAISADYIAARVAEQIIIPQSEAMSDVSSIDLDVEELSRKVADKIALPDFDPSEIKINEEKLAEAVAQRLSQIQDETAAEASPAAYGSS
ncbi:MAG: hypothetical protein K2N47_05020, partial [Clostridia bacterium]|nr:hypothetical protein [Clostridia bacterium]